MFEKSISSEDIEVLRGSEAKPLAEARLAAEVTFGEESARASTYTFSLCQNR